MQPEIMIPNTKSNKKMLPEDDTAFVVDECLNDRKRISNLLKNSDNSVSVNQIEGTRTATDASMMNGRPNDSSNMKLEILKITLDPIPVIETTTIKHDNNNVKYSHSNNSDEVTDANAVGKPYSCYICTKVFSRKSSLKCHIGMHLEGTVNSARKNGVHVQGEDKEDSAMTPNGTLNDEGQYDCDQCGRSFTTARGLYRHIGYHNSEANRKNEDAGSDIDLTLDDDADDEKYSITETEDGEPEFMCAICEKCFSSRRARSIHAAHAHKANGTLAATRDSLDPQADENSPDDEEDLCKCPYCNVYFKSRRAMNIHAAHRHKNERGDELEEMSSDDEEDLEFECDQCGRLFRSKRARSIHAVSAHKSGAKQAEKVNSKTEDEDEDEGLECEVCERKFNSVRAYDIHAEGVCGTAQIMDGSYVYVCQECPKTFAHPKSMSRHRSWHRDNRYVSTDDDEEDEAEEESTEDALDNVDRAKEYKCPHCEKCFANRQAYAGHMKAHNRPNSDAAAAAPARPIVRTKPVMVEGQKTYKCKYCDRIFTNCFGYAGHMKSHKGEALPDAAVDSASEHTSDDDDDEVDQVKMFSCRFCNKKFASPTQLGVHVKQHIANMKTNSRSSFVSSPTVEDKVYKCDACMQTFTYMSELRRHATNGCSRKRSFNSRNANNQFKCPYCEQKFLLQCHLQKHLKLRCNVNDLGGESTEDAVHDGDVVADENAVHDGADEPPTSKRVRKSTLLDSLYEYEPVGKTRRNSQKIRNDLREYEERNGERLETEDVVDEYFNIEFPASEQFVIQNLNGDEEGFVFEQYDDSQGYQCNECDETFRDKLQMIIHMSFHFNNRLPNGGCRSLTIRADSKLIAPYVCAFCEERFVNKKYRRRHLCKLHSNDIFKCDVCEKLFLFKKTLKKHCKLHMVEAKHNCEYCLKCFTSKWFLKRHLRRQCDKKLAMEEQHQSAQMAALSLDEHSDEIDGSVHFDGLINV